MADRSSGDGLAGAFGANAWLVEEMYESYLADPESVSESWREFFADYRGRAGARGQPEAPPSSPSPWICRVVPAPPTHAGRRRCRAAVAPLPAAGAEAAPSLTDEVAVPLRGAAARIVENMSASLAVPSATSVHPVPAKLLEVNRAVINDQLAPHHRWQGELHPPDRLGGGQGPQSGPGMNASFVPEIEATGTPGVIRHEHVGLGIAVDYERPGGGRTLFVPCVGAADTLDFSQFLHAYEDLVRKVRSSKLSVDDFAGVTVTITNPGTLGTTQSVPRLMSGQGAIIGVGALGYPAEYAATDPEVLAELGIGKVVVLTSTYDHRIIQGAESGLFLTRVHELLVGEHDFYDEVFFSLGVPYNPARWHKTSIRSAPARPSTAGSSNRRRCSSSSTCTGCTVTSSPTSTRSGP